MDIIRIIKEAFLTINNGRYPQALQEAVDTRRALVGKWHLASEPVGFDYYKYHISRKGEQGLYWDPSL